MANIGGALHQYSTLYVKVATLLDLQNLSNAINVNILANTPLDDELQTTQVVAEAAVAGMLGPVPGAAAWYGPPRMAALAGAFRVRNAGAWHQIPAGFVLPIRRPFVTAKLNSPHGWFQDMVNRLAGVAAAVAVAHAPLPLGPVMGLAPVMPPPVGGGPPPVAPPGGLGTALKRACVLATVAAVGVAVALNYVIPYLYPSDKPS
ncbi:hypothetical protein [Rhodanobacter hydrolyticus]|uniref:hypothetical protein n=1 Tax=Rhodanobacter hydrolyticus TaxID=2250595 RepID=UPI00384F24A8